MAAHALALDTTKTTNHGANGTVTPDPLESAAEAGLRYVSDEKPGIRRRRAGKGFRYVRPDGTPVHDEPTLRRITSLVIPPAWREPLAQALGQRLAERAENGDTPLGEDEAAVLRLLRRRLEGVEDGRQGWGY